MKFRLNETFSKSMPEWLKQQFIQKHPAISTLDSNFYFHDFDFNNAKFKEIPLSTDIKTKEKEIWKWVDKVDADRSFSGIILFILVKVMERGQEKQLVFCPNYNDMFRVDTGDLRSAALNFPENILAACYAYDWQKDEKKVITRAENRRMHNRAAFEDSNERVTYDGNPLSKDRIMLDGREFDASGYLVKPSGYYRKKLLAYQRQDYASALLKIYDKLSKASAIIKNYIASDADLLDVEDSNFVRDILRTLRGATESYNSIMRSIEKSSSEETIDDLFRPSGEVQILNNLITKLYNSIKSISYTDFNWS